MSKQIKNSRSGGVGFTGLLTIVFITLKLVGVIDWSWWWVLSPIWITVILGVLVIVVTFIVLSIKELREK
jgi:hypothetical protein